MLKEITMYTDGACSGNPGPGGWGTVLIFGEHIKEICGYMPGTTNNRMELFAVVQGFSALKQPCAVTVYSDSAYFVNAFNQHWIDNWQRNGWKNAAKQPVENQDLWKCLLAVMKPHTVKIVKVKGHADNRWNNRCDELATGQIQRMQQAEKESRFQLGGQALKTAQNSGFTQSLSAKAGE